MQPPTVCDPGVRAALVNAVEVVPNGLVGHEQSQIASVSGLRQDREKRGTLALATLSGERIESVGAQSFVRHLLG